MRRPVFLLMRALEGHPRAGLYWEKHCKDSILAAGFEQVKGWECMCMRRSLQLFLNVYVYDFKLAGRAESLPKAWALLRKRLDLDDPTSYGTYVGCSIQEHLVEDRYADLELADCCAENVADVWVTSTGWFMPVVVPTL